MRAQVHISPSTYYLHRIAAYPRPCSLGMMTITIEDLEAATHATSEREAACPGPHSNSYRFSCVYLTSDSLAAEFVSTMV